MNKDKKRGFVEYITKAIPNLGAVEYYEVLDSTNNRARTLAEAGAPDGSVVFADAQTAGRGRFARRFVSPAGCGIYMSYLVRPATKTEPGALTTCAAVAVSDAVKKMTGANAGIKWVNDVWIGEKKICGILTEGKFTSAGDLEYAIIGIGVNVLHAEMPEELTRIATSIEDATGKRLRLCAFAAEMLSVLRMRLEGCVVGAHYADYRARSVLDGRHVIVKRGEETYEAYVRGVGCEGELLLTLSSGEDTSLLSGEVVSIKPKEDQP